MEIRTWQLEDAEALRRMIRHFLSETHAQGADFPSTDGNVEFFLQLGYAGVVEGDPVLVADDAGELVGYTLMRGVEAPEGLELRAKVLRGWGTYVAPKARGSHIPHRLFEDAMLLATARGYHRIDAVVMTEKARHVGYMNGARAVGNILRVDLESL